MSLRAKDVLSSMADDESAGDKRNGDASLNVINDQEVSESSLAAAFAERTETRVVFPEGYR